MKLLDSDHCIAILRGQLDLSKYIEASEELATTAANVGELAHGAAKSQRGPENLARLDVLLASLWILPYDEMCARRFGQLKAQIERSGEAIDDAEIQIGSIALEGELTLVTHNRKHFSRLAALAGLALEDWLE